MDIFKLVGSIFIKNTDANSQIDETTGKAENMASKIGSSLSKVGESMTNLGAKLAPVSAVFAGIMTASVKTASDFTDGMAKMSTLFDTTQTSVSDLSKEFLNLSNKSGMSATELAEAGYQALSAGQSVENAVGFVETASNLARAGFTDTTTAVDVLTTAMNAYGAQAGTAQQISNKLIRTQNLGKTTVNELASSMGKIIPTAAAMNVNIDNLTSGYTSLTKQGIATAEATTYMNSMLNELGDSGTTVGKILKSKTGQSFQDLMASGMSLADVLKVLQDDAAASGTNFNELWSSSEAGKSALAVLNGGVDEFNATLETMASDTDDVSSALEKLETPSVKAKRALNQIKNSGIELGQAFLNAMAPAIDKVVGLVQKLTNWFNNLSEPTKELIAKIAAFVAVAAPALIVGGKIVSGVGSLFTSLSKLPAILSTVKNGASALFTVLKANPFVAVAAAIAALIAAFVALYKSNEEFRDSVKPVFEDIKNTIGGVIEHIRALVEKIVEWFKRFWDENGADIMAAVQAVFEKIAAVIEWVLPYIQAIIEKFVVLVKQIWENWGEDIVNIFRTAWSFLGPILEGIFNVIKGIIDFFMALISGDWEGAWNAIKNIFTGIWQAISNFIAGVWNVIVQIFQLALSIISTIWNTIWNGISSFFVNIWNGIVSYITGIWENIKSVFLTALYAVRDFVSSIFEGISETISNIWNGICEFFTGIWEDIKGVFDAALNWIKDTVKGVFGWISDTIGNIWGGICSFFGIQCDDMSNKVDSTGEKMESALGKSMTNMAQNVADKMSDANDTVSSEVEKMKDTLNFETPTPYIKTPHYSVSPSGWTLGKLAEGIVPNFTASWFAKAMDEPYLFKEPTIFGMNGQGLMGAGEAGEEVMLGKDTMMNMIRTVVAEQNEQTVGAIHPVLLEIFDLLSSYVPSLANKQIVLDTGTVVGELASDMDTALGKLYRQRRRGV